MTRRSDGEELLLQQSFPGLIYLIWVNIFHHDAAHDISHQIRVV